MAKQKVPIEENEQLTQLIGLIDFLFLIKFEKSGNVKEHSRSLFQKKILIFHEKP